MGSKILAQSGQNTFALIFDKGDEFISGLTSFAAETRLGGSHFTAIGAFSDVMLGYFDRQAKDYKKIFIEEQVEALSLVGDIALKENSPQVHAHIVVGKADGRRMAACSGTSRLADIGGHPDRVAAPPVSQNRRGKPDWH